MSRYKLIKDGVKDQETNEWITNNPSNMHWQKYQKWIEKGNTPDPMDIPDPWIRVREKRNQLLVTSDWTQLIDSPVNQEQWAEYRQQLRDIPQNYVNAKDVIWPIVPNIS